MPHIDSHINQWDLLFVITGGPGSGKSTLIAALAALGIATMPESGRAIIQEQVATGGSALPWADRGAFAERMLSCDLNSYGKAHTLDRPVFFDRGIPDVVGYLGLCQLPVPNAMPKAAETQRYNRRVFMAPPWKEIFVHDDERKQDFAEAEATYQAIRKTYLDLDYEPIDLPLATVNERAQFVIESSGTLKTTVGS